MAAKSGFFDRDRTGGSGADTPHRNDKTRGQLSRLPAERVRLDGYHVLQLLAHADEATVYRAVRLPQGMEVALKVLSPDLAGDEVVAKRFLYRGQATKRVNHPQVVHCFDVGSQQGTHFLAVELAPGESLEQILNEHQGVFPEKRVIAIGLDLAQALEAIHLEGLAHGDVSLGNVVIDADGVARLGELAPPTRMPSDDPIAVIAAYRRAGGAIAPELWHGRANAIPDMRSDVFALGALLYCLATGTAPFPTARFDDLRRLTLDMPPPDPRVLVPELSPGFSAVVRKAMARQPADRYATPSTLREDLERLNYDFAPMHARLSTALGDDGSSSWADASSSRAPGVISRGRRVPTRQDLTPLPLPPVLPKRSPWPWLIGAVMLFLAAAAFLVFKPMLAPGSAPPMAPRAPTATPVAVPALAPAAPGALEPTPTSTWAMARGRDGHGFWAELKLGEATQRLRWCAPGTFWMGSAPDELGRSDDEGRVLVTLTRGFWLGDTEVTQQLWQAVMGRNPSNYRGRVLPVESITWTQATAFAVRVAELSPSAHTRLPSEAEWEYACRAGTLDPFVGGTDAAVAYSRDNAAGSTHPVQQLAPNPWGLYDLQGNVMEWCGVAYAPYGNESLIDPRPAEGVYRVARGGAWTLPAERCRAAARQKYLATTQFFFIGVRLLIESE